MITAEQMTELHNTVSRTVQFQNGRPTNGPAGDVLDYLHALMCEMTDPEDIFQAAEDLVDAATELRDEADGVLTDYADISAANRADDKRSEWLEAAE